MKTQTIRPATRAIRVPMNNVKTVDLEGIATREIKNRRLPDYLEGADEVDNDRDKDEN